MTEATQAHSATMTTEIAEYSQTAAALGELRAKYEGVVFPVETTKGMNDAKSARKELRDLRVGLEKLRKQIKEPALRRCQMIDSEAKDITGQLTALEEPIDTQIKLEEDRKEREKAERERAEKERVEKIRVKINGIIALASQSVRDTTETLERTLANLSAFEIKADDFAEFTEEATAARDQAMGELREMLEAAKAREAAEAALAEERRKLQEEADRLAAERAEIERQKAELEAMRSVTSVVVPGDVDLSDLQNARPGQIIITNNPEAVSPDLFAHVGTIPAGATIVEHGTPGATVIEGGGVAVSYVVGVDMAAGSDETVVHAHDSTPIENVLGEADQFISAIAGYTSMQFIALAEKVEAVGAGEYGRELRQVAAMIAAGNFDEQIKLGNWTAMADADKKLALASHACVSLVLGDESMGPSVLLGNAA